ncbi:MAG: hypothetical protein LBJ00_15705 [Planctomycetaceae bacterium]|nr:hypothetical protein [Planctomycetaceae bacterium]
MKRLFKGEAYRPTGYGISTTKAKKAKKGIFETFVRLLCLCGGKTFAQNQP